MLTSLGIMRKNVEECGSLPQERKKDVKTAMEIERKLSILTGGRYETDTTYDIKD